MKENLRLMIQEFCMITTCIVAILALGSSAANYLEVVTSPHLFTMILLGSFLISFISLIFRLIKVKTPLQNCIVTCLHLFVIILFMLIFGDIVGWYEFSDVHAWITISIEVSLIYVLISFLVYHQKKIEAEDINKKLQAYKEKHTKK